MIWEVITRLIMLESDRSPVQSKQQAMLDDVVYILPGYAALKR